MVVVFLVGVVFLRTIIVHVKDPISVKVLACIADAVAIVIVLIGVRNFGTVVLIVGNPIAVNVIVTGITYAIMIHILLVGVIVQLAIIAHVPYSVPIAIRLRGIETLRAIIHVIRPPITIHVIIFLIGNTVMVNIGIAGQAMDITLLVKSKILLWIPNIRTKITNISYTIAITVKLVRIGNISTIVALVSVSVIVRIVLIGVGNSGAIVTNVTMTVPVGIYLVWIGGAWAVVIDIWHPVTIKIIGCQQVATVISMGVISPKVTHHPHTIDLGRKIPLSVIL